MPRDYKQTRVQRMERDKVIVDMTARGKSQTEIARHLNVSQQTIGKALTRIYTELGQEIRAKLMNLRVAQHKRFEWIVDQAQEQWERSKQKAVKTSARVERTPIANADGGAGTIAKTITNRDEHEQCGDPRFLKIIIEATNAQAELWGTKAPVKVAASREPSESELLDDETLVADILRERDMKRLAAATQGAIDAEMVTGSGTVVATVARAMDPVMDPDDDEALAAALAAHDPNASAP